MPHLVRISLSLEDALAGRLSALVRKNGYVNRSEFVRDLIRDRLIREKWEGGGEVVATLTLIYNHHQRGLTGKLVGLQHDCAAHVLASTHVHLSHEQCAEMIMLRGEAGAVKKLADGIKSLRGVLHAELSLCAAGGDDPE